MTHFQWSQVDPKLEVSMQIKIPLQFSPFHSPLQQLQLWFQAVKNSINNKYTDHFLIFTIKGLDENPIPIQLSEALLATLNVTFPSLYCQLAVY